MALAWMFFFRVNLLYNVQPNDAAEICNKEFVNKWWQLQEMLEHIPRDLQLRKRAYYNTVMSHANGMIYLQAVVDDDDANSGNEEEKENKSINVTGVAHTPMYHWRVSGTINPSIGCVELKFTNPQSGDGDVCKVQLVQFVGHVAPSIRSNGSVRGIDMDGQERIYYPASVWYNSKTTTRGITFRCCTTARALAGDVSLLNETQLM